MSLLSIIIPTYNEIATIGPILSRVGDAQLPAGVEKEVIIVDDCSTDGTREYLSTLSSSYIVLYQSANLGKGAAVRAGLRIATGDYIVIQDADLEYSPEEYGLLLAPLLDGSADVVYGSRYMRGCRRSGSSWWHCWVNKMLTSFSNALNGLSLTDMETCYKMFSRKVADKIGPVLVSNRFEIEPEITARIAHAGYRLREVAISYHFRPFGKGKKIGWRDGLVAVKSIIRFNLLS